MGAAVPLPARRAASSNQREYDEAVLARIAWTNRWPGQTRMHITTARGHRRRALTTLPGHRPVRMEATVGREQQRASGSSRGMVAPSLYGVFRASSPVVHRSVKSGGPGENYALVGKCRSELLVDVDPEAGRVPGVHHATRTCACGNTRSVSAACGMYSWMPKLWTLSRRAAPRPGIPGSGPSRRASRCERGAARRGWRSCADG